MTADEIRAARYIDMGPEHPKHPDDAAQREARREQARERAHERHVRYRNQRAMRRFLAGRL